MNRYIKNIAPINMLFTNSKYKLWFIGVFILCTSLITTYINVYFGETFGVLILIILLGSFVIFFCLSHPIIALTVGICLSLFVAYIIKYFWVNYGIDTNFGIGVDGIFLCGLLAVLIDQYRKKERGIQFVSNPFTFVFFIYIAFLFIELFNPHVTVYLGWISFSRRILTLFSCYIIVLYTFNDIHFVKYFIKLWLGLAFVSALYGCSQEWFGFMPLEEGIVRSAIEAGGFQPFLHEGVLRKFSFFSDPTAFGMFMAMTGIFCVILLTGPFKRNTKLKILFISIFIFLGMAYSGTRTAYLMIPSGLVLFILMTITKKNTLIIATIFVMIFGVILFGPIYSNSTINRIRTAFTLSEDMSMNLRDIKRKIVQPIIFEHPFIGGGIESSGVNGKKYDPNHYLVEYVIDSGYVRIALENGIVGLIIILIFYFVAMYLGVRNYYRIKDPELRVYNLGMTAVIYSLVIATFAQSSINQIPGGLILYGIFAIVAKLSKGNNLNVLNFNNAKDL